MATTMDRVEAIPVGPLCAEIRGVDLRQALTADVVAQIKQAWWQNLAIVFRDQELSEDEQVRFAKTLGTLGKRESPSERRGVENASDYFLLVTNIRKDGKPIGSIPDGEMMFHSDMAYTATPHLGTMLYAMQVPAHGGETKLSNQYRAYEQLSAATRKRLEGKTAVQVYSYGTSQGEGRVLYRDREPLKSYSQPMVIVHPETGRKALYVSSLMTIRVDGVSQEESDEILTECFEVSERPDNIYTHPWRVGDLLVWDNRCCNHARNHFPDDEIRLMRRCTILAEAPLIAA